LFSVFDDGTYLESANTKPPKLLQSNVPVRLSFLPNASALELFEQHCDQVRELEAEKGIHVLHFTAEQYQEVASYGHRLSGWELHQQGVMWTGPQGIGEMPTTDRAADRIGTTPIAARS
jgi:hypothetical protein